MKAGVVFGVVVGVVLAVLGHAGVILFGGLLVPGAEKKTTTTQEVELLSEEADEKQEPKEEETVDEKPEEMETEAEAPPDAAEIVKSLDVAPANDAPALDAASLSAIEAALSGQGASGDFVESLSFDSGGRLDGTGKRGLGETTLENAFDPADIDQKPRAVFQAAPSYPSEMRGKKLEGLVTVIFIVDPSGKVSDPKVESSSHSAFDRPALDAVRRWKFEPGLKGGERVPCRMRVPIRFQQS